MDKISHILAENKELSDLFSKVDSHIISRMQIRYFKKNEILIHKEFPYNEVYILSHGVVNLMNHFANGYAFSLGMKKAVHFLNYLPALSGSTYSTVTITAQEDCTLLLMSFEDFLYWMKRDSKISFYIAQNASNILYDLTINRGKDFYTPNHIRLIAYLIDHLTYPSIEYKLKLTREDISNYLGISTRTVNRIIKMLADQNYISLMKGKININNAQRKLLLNVLNKEQL